MLFNTERNRYHVNITCFSELFAGQNNDRLLFFWNNRNNRDPLTVDVISHSVFVYMLGEALFSDLTVQDPQQKHFLHQSTVTCLTGCHAGAR